jgi:S-adenosylmethionine:tRNA ribosyltransferase-isomerase
MTMLAKLSGGTWAAKPDSQESPFTLLEQVGRIPLPHYIRDGQMVDSDVKDYQTVFARHPGSVARRPRCLSRRPPRGVALLTPKRSASVF